MLLSNDATLQTSSKAKWDNPLVYRYLFTEEKGGGLFHTNAEAAPWAQVTLKGKAEIREIILVNRWEHHTKISQVPMTISISNDGKTWEAIHKITKLQNAWHIDLRGKGIKGKYLKFQIQNSETKKDYFHLRNILIYGKKLY